MGKGRIRKEKPPTAPVLPVEPDPPIPAWEDAEDAYRLANGFQYEDDEAARWLNAVLATPLQHSQDYTNWSNCDNDTSCTVRLHRPGVPVPGGRDITDS